MYIPILKYNYNFSISSRSNKQNGAPNHSLCLPISHCPLSSTFYTYPPNVSEDAFYVTFLQYHLFLYSLPLLPVTFFINMFFLFYGKDRANERTCHLMVSYPYRPPPRAISYKLQVRCLPFRWKQKHFAIVCISMNARRRMPSTATFTLRLVRKLAIHLHKFSGSFARSAITA